MVNPGAFRGSRKEFLLSKKPEYAAAVAGHYTADAIAKIQRQYLKRYPMDLPHNQEPDASFLQAVDDNAPDPEPEEPNADTMSESEYKAAVEAMKDRKFNLEYRKKQIRRWFNYQYIKDNDIRSKETGAYMPYAALIQKLTGKEVARPRLKTPVNVWRKTDSNRDLIEKHLKAEVELERRLGNIIPSTLYASIRDRIAREIFAGLDEGTRREAREKAAAEHRLALEKYREEICDNPSRDPADLQMAIQGMIPFLQPIMDIVCDFTGFKLSMFGGGPEPAQGGRLSIISIHSGYSSGDVKMTYGRSERAVIRKHLITSFGRFLKTCYTPDECRERALDDDDDDGFMPMSSYESDTDEITYHTMENDTVEANKAPTKGAAMPTVTTSSPPTPVLLPPIAPESEVQNDIEPTSAATTSEDSRRHISQDSLPSDTNPFPFDLDEEEEDEILGNTSRVDGSPLHSAPPTPACSRVASPEPMSASRHLEDDTSTTDSAIAVPVNVSVNATMVSRNEEANDAIMPSVKPLAPVPSVATPIPAPPVLSKATVAAETASKTKSRKRKSASDAGTTPAAVVEPASKRPRPAAASSVATPVATSAPAPPVLSNGTVAAEETSKAKSRKRKSASDGGTTLAAVVEPASKRPRTKTMRAIASEEQSNMRKRNDVGKAAGARASGKENSVVGGVGRTKSSRRENQV